MTASTKPAPLVTVYDGRDCIGFIIAHGKHGFEAFDREERSLGTYRTQLDAAAAISGAMV